MFRLIFIELISLMLMASCSRENNGFLYISKDQLEARAKMSFKNIRYKLKNADYEELVISQQDSVKRIDSMYFFAEQFILSTKGLNDTLVFLNDKNKNTFYLFDSRKKTPIAITIHCSDLYSHTEIIVGENGLLRKRVSPEIQLNSFDTKYYYVDEESYKQIALGLKRPIFLEKEFTDRYKAMQQKGLLNTFLLISEFNYHANLRPYLVQVVFTKK